MPADQLSLTHSSFALTAHRNVWVGDCFAAKRQPGSEHSLSCCKNPSTCVYRESLCALTELQCQNYRLYHRIKFTRASLQIGCSSLVAKFFHTFSFQGWRKVKIGTSTLDVRCVSQLVWLSGCFVLSSAPCVLSLCSTLSKARGQAGTVFLFNEPTDNGCGGPGETWHKLPCLLTGISGNYCSPWQINGIAVQHIEATLCHTLAWYQHLWGHNWREVGSNMSPCLGGAHVWSKGLPEWRYFRVWHLRVLTNSTENVNNQCVA